MLLSESILFAPVIRAKIPGLQLGVLVAENFVVAKKSELVQHSFDTLFSFVKNKFQNKPPSSDPTVSAVRRMYRRIGWEPTRYRPSSEAMLRRILKDKGLYNINNAVDLGNAASARYHLPMGLYDLKKIDGVVTCDVGMANEEYQGLSKELIHAEGKLILRDHTGIFGNPTADSRRTCIDTNTTSLVALFFTPPEVHRAYLEETLNHLGQLYQDECNAVVDQSILVCE